MQPGGYLPLWTAIQAGPNKRGLHPLSGGRGDLAGATGILERRPRYGATPRYPASRASRKGRVPDPWLGAAGPLLRGGRRVARPSAMGSGPTPLHYYAGQTAVVPP